MDEMLTRVLACIGNKRGSQKELAEHLDIHPNVITNWKNGTNKSYRGYINEIADYCSVSVEYLRTGVEQEKPATISDDGLSPRAIEVLDVDGTLNDVGHTEFVRYGKYLSVQGEYKGTDKSALALLPKAKKRNDGFVEFKVYDQPAAAGLGNLLDEPDFHVEQFPAYLIPARADFGVIISGDSMEPAIPNGHTVFVQAGVTVPDGAVGIFVLNGQSYCKRLVIDRNSRTVLLRSNNPKYGDITVGASDDLRAVGTVLGAMR